MTIYSVGSSGSGANKTLAHLWSLNRVSGLRPRRLMRGFDPIPLWGRCQLYLWVRSGRWCLRGSDVWQARAQAHSRRPILAGPFSQSRLNEPLGFSVGLWRGGLGADMLDVQCLAGRRAGPGPVA